MNVSSIDAQPTEMDQPKPDLTSQQPPTPAVDGAQTETAKKEKKIVQMPSDALKRIREKEREKGRKAAQAEMDQKARQFGYRDFASMEAALAKKKATQSPTKPGQPPVAAKPAEPTTEDAAAQPNGGRPDRRLTKLERENQRLLEAKRAANRARAHEEKRRRELENELDLTKVEYQLRQTALESGITNRDNIGYALHLLRSHIEGKSEKELEGFDEAKYFQETLRKSHPYLFGVETRPANTSNGNSTPSNGAPPKPGQPAPPQGETQPVDARKLSQEDFYNRLRKLGLTPPSAGMPT